MMVNNLEKIEGIWVATEIQVAKKKGGQTVHRTILKFDNVKFSQDLEAELFSIRRMEKGL